MGKRAVVLVVAFAVLAAGCDWWQWAGNGERRGSNIALGLTSTTASTWVASKVLDLEPTSPVVTANGLGFVHSDGRLVAFDPATSAIAWDAPLPEGSTAGGAPAINSSGQNSTIFLVVSTPTHPVLLGFDVDGARNCNAVTFRCAPVFTADLGSAPGEPSPVLVDANRVFARGADTLYAFDALGQAGCTGGTGSATCAPLWSTPTGATVNGVGPAVLSGVVYDAETDGSDPVLRAYDGSNGALLWTGALDAPATATPSVSGDGRVFVPAGDTIEVFAAEGCGSPSCEPGFSLVRRSGDPAGDFLSTPAHDAGKAVATNANGTVSWWPTSGCGDPTCEPTVVGTAHTPAGGSSAFRQSPVIASGLVLVLAERQIEGADHVVLVALDPANGGDVKVWDFGGGELAAGLANPSVANHVIYAPVAGALFAVRAPAVQPLASLSTSPLTLSPAFDPAISDYTVRCAAGTNSVTFDMTATTGGTVGLTAPTATAPAASASVTVDLTPNQAAVVRATNAQGAGADYWIRCLPPDFPQLTVTRHPSAGTPTPGYYLLGNNILPSGGTSYAMVLDTNGTPVWYKRSVPPAIDVTPTRRHNIAFMATQTFTGFTTDPNAKFDEYSLDTGTVQSIRTVGVPTDFHELTVRPNGNRLLLSYALRGGVDLTGLNATPTPGPDSTIADCIVQEVNPQGQVVWQWTGSDHLDPVTEPTTAPSVMVDGTRVYDVFHCNSIDAKPNGDVLVSIRHLNAVVEVRRSDGQVVWKLGGKPTNRDGAAIIQIQNDPEGGIVQQHDARYLDDDHIALYDNQSPETAKPARGIEYAIDFATSTAQPVFSFASQEGLPSCCMGSYRRMPDGHAVVGWGYMIFNGRAMTEVNAAGNAVLDIGFPVGNGVYRAIKVPPTFYKLAQLRSRAGT